jgi:YfiH family protein
MARRIGLDLAQAAIPNQVHGQNVELAVAGRVHKETDGLFTADPSVVLSLQVADCAPVFFHHPGTGFRGLVHAGWRGLAGGVLEAGVELLHAQGIDLSRVTVAIGPTIEMACYEVGAEVVERFPATVWKPNSHGRFQLDLVKAVNEKLAAAGIPAESIQSMGVCTVCDTRCHSYRRDGQKAGRMVAFYRDGSSGKHG